MSPEEVVETQSIASLRTCIHVEREINKVKSFHLWDSILPFTMFGVVNQMCSACAMLYNFQNSIISFNADGDSPVMEVTELSVPNPWHLNQNNFKFFGFLSWSITFWNCTDNESYPLHIPPCKTQTIFLPSFTACTTLHLQ